jgi:hypothetical protein
MTDIGISCAKDSYGRGAGKVLTCTKDQEEDAGLCYEPCEHQADGVGPVCWGHCPVGTKPCGDFLCLDEVEICTSTILEDTVNVGEVAFDIATHPLSEDTAIDIAKVESDFGWPNCPTWY